MLDEKIDVNNEVDWPEVNEPPKNLNKSRLLSGMKP